MFIISIALLFSLLAPISALRESALDASLDDLDVSDHLDVLDKLSSISTSREEEVVDKFNKEVSDFLKVYEKSILDSLRLKNRILLSYLQKRGVGEADQIRLIKDWAASGLEAIKDRADYGHRRLRGAVAERWRFGRGEAWRRSPFYDGQRSAEMEDKKHRRLRASRLIPVHTNRRVRKVIFP